MSILIDVRYSLSIADRVMCVKLYPLVFHCLWFSSGIAFDLGAAVATGTISTQNLSDSLDIQW